MNKLLILGTSLVSAEIVQTAREMGFYTIVTDNLRPADSIAKSIADEYWMISTGDLDTLELKCREEKVDAIFAGVSEFNLDMVKELTDRLDLPCYIEDSAWKIARDKHAFKEKCREAGISVAEDYYLSGSDSSYEFDNIDYPVVVKPVDGAGNKGLSICSNEEELKLGCENAFRSSEKGDTVVEQYLTGEEQLHYYLIAEDSIKHAYSVVVFKEPGYPSFVYPFVTTAVDSIQDFEEQVNEKCIYLLKAIGCKSGMAWLQFIRDENGSYYALEMGHRLCAASNGKSIKKLTGVNIVEWMLDTTIGKNHADSMLPQTVLPPYKTSHCIYFQFAAKAGTITSYQGYEELDRNKFHVSLIAHTGAHVEKNRLLARIVFNASDSREMCENLRTINETTRILNEQNENMYVRFDNYNQVINKTAGLFSGEPKSAK